jgi:hypothetical protein
MPRLRDSNKKFYCSKFFLSIFAARFRWPVRLSARTTPFHGVKRGSIPLRATKLLVTLRVQKLMVYRGMEQW